MYWRREERAEAKNIYPVSCIALLESGIGNRYGGNSKLSKGFSYREMLRKQDARAGSAP